MVASIPNDIFQFSTWAAVQKGFSTGQPRAADLTSHGTDGTGVFEDGKLMILSDRKAYSIAGSGELAPAQPQERLCFAMVTVFSPLRIIKTDHSDMSMKGLEEMLSSVEALPGLGGMNSVLPFNIEGTFTNLELVTAGGPLHKKGPTAGVMVGFMVPMWMEGISGPRMHCHFMSKDNDGANKVGGRVLSVDLGSDAVIAVGKCGRFHLGFPQGQDWEGVQLA
ncbi:hypothetical protein BU23DRAFT_90975 [Bimuria novae-zelandiae CBS 107.79]|uniref:Alpha-acetolactate decarboxylase n=1 Tax=Bimuria novae-zelandiae CBS 107.79 TaxID=1447943 RepID=A0A6A5VFY6_9PLEO|nr:hypothetical protein BU23DRAFT_90975 [Bimuria novae-zelandiae CBS 107.79]